MNGENIKTTECEPAADMVRFNLYLPREAYEALEKLRVLTGKRSLADTVRSAVKVFSVIQEAAKKGKSLLLVDEGTGDKQKVIIT